MLLVLPTEGSDDDVWDQLLNDVLGGANGVDAHDHSHGRGKQVPVAGLDVDGDLPLNAHRLTGATGLAFQALGGALAVGAREVFVGPDNNLYYRNAVGVNVRITNGSTLDVTSVGGIAGDYAAVGAEVAYVDASDTYTLRQQVSALVRQYARAACAGVDLYEYRAAGVTPAPANRVRLSSPAALAASYELVMPAALPAAPSQKLLQFSNTVGTVGQFLLDNTITEPIVMQAGATVGANQHVVVSGTGRYKHGLETLTVPVVAPAVSPGAPFTQRFATVSGAGSGASDLHTPIVLPVGRRIVNLRVATLDNISGTTRTQAIINSQVSGGNLTPVAGSLTNQSLGNSTLQVVQATSINATIAASTTYYVHVFNGAGTANCFIRWIEIDYDLP